METVNYQESIVEIFDKKLKPGVNKILPNTFTNDQKKDRIEAMRDFMTTLTYDYNEKDEVAYDENKHMFKVPNSLKSNPENSKFDLEHDLVQLTITSICPVRDPELSPYLSLYADSLATVLVGNATLEQNEQKYSSINMLGMEGIDLLTDIFYTGNIEKVIQFKNMISKDAEMIDVEEVKTRS